MMFFLVTATFALGSPGHFTLAVVNFATTDVGVTFAAVGVFGDTVPAITDVAALAEHLRPIRIGELDKVMIEDLSVIDAIADLAPALPLRFNGVRVFKPVRDIQIVYVLFYDVVATQPIEVIPVAHLVFELTLTLLTWTYPYATAIPINTCEVDVTDGTVLEACNGFAIGGLVMTL